MKVRLPVLLAVAALLLLAVVAARGSSGIPTGTPNFGTDPPSPNAPQPPSAPPISSEPIAYGAGVMIILVGIALLLGLAMGLVLLAGIRFRRLRRERLQTPLRAELSDPGERWLHEASRRALSEMDQKIGGPPSDAVIAAWVQLEQSAAATGIEREPHQTPTEFTTAVLAGSATDAEAVGNLRKLYHRARFGEPGNVTQDDAAAARRALEKIS